MIQGYAVSSLFAGTCILEALGCPWIQDRHPVRKPKPHRKTMGRLSHGRSGLSPAFELTRARCHMCEWSLQMSPLPRHLSHHEPFKSSQSTRHFRGRKSCPLCDVWFPETENPSCNEVVAILYYILVVCYSTTDHGTVFDNSLLNDWFSIKWEVSLNEHWNKRNLCGPICIIEFFPPLWLAVLVGWSCCCDLFSWQFIWFI